MPYLLSILVFLLIFSILILIHEFGHFFAARKTGVKVEEFGLGLPPRLKKFWTDRHGTIFSLNWIPFGGYVRMTGEDTLDTEMQHNKESFSGKSPLVRVVIVVGGVLMNFLLGYVILVFLFTSGTKPLVVSQEDFKYYREQGIIQAEDKIIVMDFAENSLGEKAGLKKGDMVKSIDGIPVVTTQAFVDIAQKKAGSPVQVELIRDKQMLSLSVPVNLDGKMGIVIAEAPDIKEVKTISYSFPKSLIQAGYEIGRLSGLTMKMFVKVLFDLVTKAKLSSQVSGPVGIAELTYHTTQAGDIAEILKLVALLSISLGAINVLPIPALDGGRFLSIAFELLTRKRPNAIWEHRIHAFGFVLLLLLIVAVTYQDIVKLLSSG